MFYFGPTKRHASAVTMERRLMALDGMRGDENEERRDFIVGKNN